MDGVRQYLLSVVTTAIICAVAIIISGNKSMISSMIKILAGLVMSITVISPLVKLQISDFSNYLAALEIEADGYIDEGEAAASFERSAIITEQIESYILGKATSLGMSIEVEVNLSDSEKQIPSHVRLIGDASPYNKQLLQKIIENDLGIPEENQSWT